MGAGDVALGMKSLKQLLHSIEAELKTTPSSALKAEKELCSSEIEALQFKMGDFTASSSSKASKKAEKAFSSLSSENDYKALLEVCPFWTDVHKKKIIFLFNKAKYTEAIDAARKLASYDLLSPDETDYILGRLYLASGQLKLGRKYIDQCARNNPEDRRALALRRTFKAMDARLLECEKKLLLKDSVLALEGLLEIVADGNGGSGSSAKSSSFTLSHDGHPSGVLSIFSEDDLKTIYDPDFKSTGSLIWGGYKLDILKLQCTKMAKRKQFDEGMKACQEAAKLDKSSNAKAFYLVKEAELFSNNGKKDDALKKLKEATAENNDSSLGKEISEKMKKLEKEVKERMKVKYYDLLGLTKDASTSEIKKAYNRAVRVNHPDKLNSPTKEEADKALEKMAEINLAYETLSDPKKRQQYDAGFDPNDPNAANQQYSSFTTHHSPGGGFGGGGGFGFNMDDIIAQMQQQQNQQQRNTYNYHHGGSRGGRGGQRQQQHQGGRGGQRGYSQFFHEDL